ncbi:cell wall-binding repeat-containing protein [Schumannella luteola]
MRARSLVVGAVAILFWVNLVGVSPAQALPSESDRYCDGQTLSPVRGEEAHATLEGVHTFQPDLPAFDPAWGELVSLRYEVTVLPRISADAMALDGFHAQILNLSVGGWVRSGLAGNGADLGNVVASVSLVTSSTGFSQPKLGYGSASATRTYSAAEYASSPTFATTVEFPEQYIDPAAFDWRLYEDQLHVNTCVTYNYDSPRPTVDRVAGADRYSTAVRIAEQSSGGTVFITTGTNYPDALSAAPLAAQLDAPLLLVTPTSVPATVRAYLASVGPDKIIVVGGTPSVSAAVYSELSAYAASIERIAGADRYETSRLLAARFGTADVAFVATGRNFPDALVAGAAAGHLGGPVILVDGAASDLDTATADLIDDLDIAAVRVVGDLPSVSNGVYLDLYMMYLPGMTIRLAGADRFETARAVNREAFGEAAAALIATGNNFPDALAGSAWGGASDRPLYLSPQSCVPMGVLTDLGAYQVGAVTLLGGTPSLGTAVENLIACT